MSHNAKYFFPSKDFLKAAHSLSYSLSRTPIRDKDFKRFLDGKKDEYNGTCYFFRLPLFKLHNNHHNTKLL